jgi:lysophospholipase L1-like esterase
MNRHHHLRFAAGVFQPQVGSLRFRSLPGWVFISLAANGFLLILVLASVLRLHRLSLTFPATASAVEPRPAATVTTADVAGAGERRQLTYEQWVSLLAQEARVAAEKRPPRLTVLLGDSLSLWFPVNLLLPDRVWLNQGISGETSAGLLERVELLDGTQPETIFMMIGINDLIRGGTDDAILQNQEQIIQHLKDVHPTTQVVVQSILPHADERATWEGRDRLLAVSNSRIRRLNAELAAIAAREDAYFLDLYPLFSDRNGNLRMDLSTDGLHLNPQGYLVWRTALEMYSQLKLSEREE